MAGDQRQKSGHLWIVRVEWSVLVVGDEKQKSGQLYGGDFCQSRVVCRWTQGRKMDTCMVEFYVRVE